MISTKSELWGKKERKLCFFTLSLLVKLLQHVDTLELSEQTNATCAKYCVNF